MVGFEPGQRTLTQAEYAGAGAVSGVLTRTFIQPLDVIKIRFQLQVEPIAHTTQSKYFGTTQAFSCIVREEGLSALWKGHVAAQLLSVIYGISQFVAFESLTAFVGLHLPQKYTTTYRPLTHSVCGGLAGSFASVCSHPCDVIRTRLVAQGTPKTYVSVLHAARVMVHNEGPLALFKGLTPTLLAIGPQAGFQFGFYSLFNQTWVAVQGRNAEQTPGWLRSFLCGSGAGVCAKLAVYPLDLTKKRLEVQGFERGRQSFGRTDQYRGLTHCLRSVAQKEGLPALFKGLQPSLIKAAVSSGCIFFFYEQCCKLLLLVDDR